MSPPNEAKSLRSKRLRRVRKVVMRWGYFLRNRLGLVAGPATRGYMICATTRSGSTFLMQVLASTQCLGNPAEYFNTPYWRQRDPKYPKHPREQLDVVRTRGATSNGIYAVKAHAFQIKRMGENVDPFTELPNLKLVRIVRRDMIARAISLSRAKQSGQYSTMSPRRQEAVYREDSIRNCLSSLREQEAVWDDILARFETEVLILDYHDVMRDPQLAADQVARLMGVEPAPVNTALITVAVQRDETTNAWHGRFLADTGEEFRHLS